MSCVNTSCGVTDGIPAVVGPPRCDAKSMAGVVDCWAKRRDRCGPVPPACVTELMSCIEGMESKSQAQQDAFDWILNDYIESCGA